MLFGQLRYEPQSGCSGSARRREKESYRIRHSAQGKTKNQEINRRISAVVGPNEKGRIVIDALKPLKHPEILKKMKIMRNDPFARCDRNASCNMSNVKRITIKAVMHISHIFFIIIITAPVDLKSL